MENPIPDRPYTERRSSGFQGGSWEERAAAEPPPAQPLIVNYCRVCGRGLTAAETAHVQGAVYCPEHAPRMQPGYGQAPYPPPPAGAQGYRAPEGPSPYSVPMGSASPGLAFLLGLIPGVGAVYNAQYVKAIVHVVVFGLLVSILSSGAADGIEPLFGMLAAIWYFYMPFEAYHTARKRTMGLPVDDISSIFPMQSRSSGIPVGPVILIALGVIFLLAQFDLISFGALLRYWPVLLIVAGGWMLYERMALKGQGS
ncbi:MAG: DUF5668 domain-containing protein [Bryobacterales bacterium]|nr:DUF5668 domain-containing protein [Bryobacterales bacterium]